MKNATANVVRGSASALVALFLPPFLTRSMSPDAFAAWSLILQMSAYVGYLDFGIQTAIARFIAHDTERKEAQHRDGIVSTALAFLILSGAIAFLGLVVLCFFLPQLFHQLHGSLLLQVRVALLLVGGSLSIGLPASVFSGTFVGLQRNEVPAGIIGGSRLLNAALLILIVRQGGGIIAMGVAAAAVNLASYAVQFVAYQRLTASLEPSMSLARERASRSYAKELIDYCGSLTIWAIGLILVTGLDLTIVGAYRFDQVGYYAIAATVVNFLGGLFGALFSAMGSPAAVLHAREDKLGLGRMVSTGTRLGMLLLLATGLPLIFGASRILNLWVGSVYAQHTALLVQLLVTAHIIRLSVSPYTIAMIGTGEQRRIILVPLLEGAANLIASLIAGYYWGAAGVAFGTLIGALVSLAGHFFYNMRRSITVQLGIGEYLREAYLRPILCATPVLILGFSWNAFERALTFWPLFFIVLLGSILTLILVWYVGLTSIERGRFIAMLTRRTSSN
ncbi:hypothetical protein [Terriglobus sp. RCC_193]|uniref:hypothetical protein n=1 Tax=Terriglobus sp. RCC_193 TaxID=3239218 RepID=UPI0035253924